MLLCYICFKLQRSITMLVLNHFYKHCLRNSSTTDPNVEDGAYCDVSAESYLEDFFLILI